MNSSSSINAPNAAQSEHIPTDYTTWSQADLISRVSELEQLLHSNTTTSSTAPNTTSLPTDPSPPIPTSTLNPSAPKTPLRTFDPSKYSTRHIALKFAYLGQAYNGYECANGNTTPLPTVEEVLWKALRKGRLISPPSTSSAGEDSLEVMLDPKQRMKTPVYINWEGCQYSKCGRTDRGVSAFGQVIGIRVRSNRPFRPEETIDGDEKKENTTKAADAAAATSETNNIDVEASTMDDLPTFDSEPEASDSEDKFDSIRDELPYLSILNSLLPRDIRALAWCPNPPPDFDARFSCGQRRYRYFFTNPAFLPTPGPTGLKDQRGQTVSQRTGYLDIEAMREGCKNYVGLHDFRNLCRIDETKQLAHCQRRILHASINEVEQQDGPQFLSQMPEMAGTTDSVMNGVMGDAVTELVGSGAGGGGKGPKVYCFEVHGTAFLWHQIRCMVAVLFLIGQRLEKPSLVKELLDIEKNPRRPTYEMATDAPLVLWDCLFPEEDSKSGEDALNWICAGDARGMSALKTKSDGKFGLQGTVDDIWKTWRQRKIDEVLAASLLDLVATQGDGSSLKRGGSRNRDDRPGSQKIFDGGDSSRFVGKYIPVMQKPKTESLEVQNARWRESGKGSRRMAKRAEYAAAADE